MKTIKWLAIGTVVCLLVNFKAAADTLYNNSANNTGYRLTMSNGQQVGTEILLGTAPNSEYLTNFSFNFYSSGTYADVTLEVLLQLNNGTPAFNGYDTPGTVIYDSGAFQISSQNGDGGLDFNYNDLTVGDTVPLNQFTTIANDFTLSFVVEGLAEGDTFALDLYDPATVGSNYGDYWLNTGTVGSPNWELLTNSMSGPIGVASVFQGSLTPAPEPAALSLSILGGAGLLLAIRRRRQ
jgi:hypothetical protein